MAMKRKARDDSGGLASAGVADTRGRRARSRDLEGIGSRIHEIRKVAGLSQVQFAELAGVAQSYLSEVEAGKSKPSLEIIAGLLKLQVPVSLRYVLLGYGEPFHWQEGVSFSDLITLEAVLIRAARDEASLPVPFDCPHISDDTYRRWLARNIFDQADSLGVNMSVSTVAYANTAEEKANAMDQVEAAIRAAERRETRAVKRRVSRRSKGA